MNSILHQALRQTDSRNVRVEDGWVYLFMAGHRVVGQVLDIEITPELFDQLDKAAATTRS